MSLEYEFFTALHLVTIISVSAFVCLCLQKIKIKLSFLIITTGFFCYIFFRVGRVCQLVAAGISINARDSEGSKNTPLHWAACYGNRDIVACLLGNIKILEII